ncbi:hypothetical protein [Gordonia hongkongensis]|uniref:Uncharacterized protein n=1 Tax=Gordonia hongkongensis TaxID=1701090 RepID=A0ABT6BYT0_9ACTN|nr:hypothetical protein [Gordonia hongkongensis]MDF6103116.1 hypothetical protein [Gordonia hongkongensis]
MTQETPPIATGQLSEDSPCEPNEPNLDPNDPRTQLQARLRTVLVGLPAFFEFDNHIAGVEATDLHALNTLLGAAIEGQVVKALNQQRALWDPDDEWLGYTFERQSQRFPDVLLTKKGGDGGPDIALGVELKGWFLLAKEGEPSFRFGTTPAACADHDLLVVVPWYLDNVLSGSPSAAEPFVVSARWAAEYRNYYWEHTRKVRGSNVDRTVRHPKGAHPYPTKDELTLDVPGYDGGGNFGRVARVSGLMDDFVKQSNDLEVLGISVGDWNWFLRIHSDQADPAEVRAQLFQQLRQRQTLLSKEKVDRLKPLIQALVDAWDDADLS